MTGTGYLAVLAALLTTTWVGYQLGIDHGWHQGYQRAQHDDADDVQPRPHP